MADCRKKAFSQPPASSIASCCPQVPPVLVVTDTPCLLEGQLSRRCPEILEGKGELPREPPSAAFPDGRVSLPCLRHLACHAAGGTQPPPHAHGTPERRRPHASSSASAAAPGIPRDVYALRRACSPHPGVQRYLDFRLLLELSARVEAGLGPGVPWPEEGDAAHYAVEVWWKALSCLESLHASGSYVLDLFEVVMMLGLWHNAAAQRRRGGGGGAGSDMAAREGTVEHHANSSRFIARVCSVATGVRGHPWEVLPAFYAQALRGEGGLVSDREAIVNLTGVSDLLAPVPARLCLPRTYHGAELRSWPVTSSAANTAPTMMVEVSWKNWNALW